jgi:hypothetical protein
MADNVTLNLSMLSSNSFDNLLLALTRANIGTGDSPTHEELVSLVMEHFAAVRKVVVPTAEVSTALGKNFLAPPSTQINEDLMASFTSVRSVRTSKERETLMEFFPPIRDLPPVRVLRKIDQIGFSDADRGRETFLYKLSKLALDACATHLHLADAYLPLATADQDSMDFVHAGLHIHADLLQHLDQERLSAFVKSTKLGSVEFTPPSTNDLVTDDMRKLILAQAEMTSKLYRPTSKPSDSQRGRGRGRGSNSFRGRSRGRGRSSQAKATAVPTTASNSASLHVRSANAGAAST